MIYFLTEKRIKDLTPVLGNVDAKLIMPLIPSTADQFIKPRTGTHYFNHLLSVYNTQTATPTEVEIINIIQNSLMWRIASEVALTSSAQITNKGLQEQDGLNSSQAGISKIGMMTGHYNKKADFYDARLIDFLWKNKESLLEFKSKLNIDCDVDLYPSKATPYNDVLFL